MSDVSLNCEVMAEKTLAAVERLALDLRGKRVLTEAATGAYVVTPVIAAVAGAEVTALTRSSRYGTVDHVRRETGQLATKLGVVDRIRIVEDRDDAEIAAADIVTNSGHLRPLDASFVSGMTPGAVIVLMYESWELREGEVALDVCQQRGIVVAGTNERHAKVRVFDYLGLLALYGLFQCRVPPAFSRILLICDNPFAPHIAETLVHCHAVVELLGTAALPAGLNIRRRVPGQPSNYDAVVVADTPTELPILGRKGAAKYAVEDIGRFHSLVQVWGDVDRNAMPGMRVYPEEPPAPGHMGVLLCDIGPDPVIRLQAGGLKVGQVMLGRPDHPPGPSAPAHDPDDWSSLVQPVC
jgi:hypothetical protein